MAASFVCPSCGYRIRPNQVVIDSSQLKCHHCKAKFYAGKAEKVFDATAAPSAALPVHTNGREPSEPTAFASVAAIPAPLISAQATPPPIVADDDMPVFRAPPDVAAFAATPRTAVRAKSRSPSALVRNWHWVVAAGVGALILLSMLVTYFGFGDPVRVPSLVP